MIERFGFDEILEKMKQNSNAMSFLLNNQDRTDSIWLKAFNQRIIEQVRLHRMLGLK